MGNTGNRHNKITLSGLLLLAGFTAVIFLGSAGISIAPEKARIARISTPAAEAEALRDVANPLENMAIVESEPYGNGKTFFLSIPAVVTNCSLDNNRPYSRNVANISSENLRPICSRTFTTADIVSAKKAAEFTLVGARPSGTS